MSNKYFWTRKNHELNLFNIVVNTVKDNIKNASNLIKEGRVNDNCFTRNRKISDQQLLLYGLINAPGAISENLVDLYKEFGVSIEDIPTRQALSQKRKLIDETPYYKAFQSLVASIYQPENRKQLKTFNGLFPVGIDGSDVDIPNNPKLKEVFGTIGRGSTSVTAKGSVAFDLLNQFLLDGLLAPLKEGERELMRQHLKNVPEYIPARLILYIMDRGYYSSALFKEIDDSGSKFICRCPIGLCHEVDDAPTEAVITLKNGLVVKVIKLKLDSGKIEVLVTNILDLDEHDAYELYNLRWNIEENYKIIKSHLHLECFNGCSETVVRQEFYAVLINNQILSALAQFADAQIEQKEGNKYKYKANRNRCVQALRRNLVALLTQTDKEKIKEVCAEILTYALRDKVPVRPERKYPRKIKRAVRFHPNIRYV